MGNPKAIQKAQEITERRARVMDLRVAGIRDQRAIAKQLGVSLGTINGDFTAINKELKARAIRDAEHEREIDLERNAQLVASHWAAAKRGHLGSTDRVIKLLDQRAKLLGLNAPDKHENTHTIAVDEIVTELAEATGISAAEIVAEAERIKSIER